MGPSLSPAFLTDVDLMGMHLTAVYLIGVHLTAV
jgi:hypothetical protein